MNKKVISLFSGGGGLDMGFINAGYNIIWAIDNNPNAVSTYKANIGENIICDDINKIDPKSLPKADIVIGGPPCQSFSLAGKRDAEDERGKLVWSYINIIKTVKPQAFLFENVIGILSAKTKDNKKVFDLLKSAFIKLGYNIVAQVINAADYGVPQRRKRVIIVGLKNDKKFEFPNITHTEDGKFGKKYVSVQSAIGDLPNLLTISKKKQNSTSVTEHELFPMSELDKYIIKNVKPGGNYMDIPKTVKSKRIRRLQKEGGHTTCYGRLDPNKPAYTINTYFNRPNVGCNIHYKENRLISVREAMRLQTFPDNYILVCKNKKEKNLLIGNAVPPLLAEVLAKQLKRYVK